MSDIHEDGSASITSVNDLFQQCREIAELGSPEGALACLKNILPRFGSATWTAEYRRRALILLAHGTDIRGARQLGRLGGSLGTEIDEAFKLRSVEFLRDAHAHLLRDPPPAKSIRMGNHTAATTLFELRERANSAVPAPSVFISYRRADSQEMTGFIAQRIQAKIGAGKVFMDVDSIPFGVNYRSHIVSSLSKCRVCLVIIGPEWLTASSTAGERRIEDPTDLVRVEIESALKISVPVVPLFIRGAKTPAASALPNSIRELAGRNGMKIRPYPDFENDMDRLLDRLQLEIGTI